EAEMRRHNIPLFSQETTTPLSEFDVIGFSLQYDLSYTNILNMLDLAGIPLLASERTDEHPIIIAGGPCAFNPEPLAEFIDAFLIGEGEEAVLEMVEALRAAKSKTRVKKLEALEEIEGVYAPSFYETTTLGDGTVVIKGAGDDVLIKKRVVADLDEAVFPTKIIVPFMPAIHDRIRLEVLRGCTQGCRFCQAGMIYRPVRERSLGKLGELLEQSIAKTGDDEASLLSLSTCDYGAIHNLVKQSVDVAAPHHVAISFPSTRIDSFDIDLAAMVQSVKKTGLTFAPEAGTERLRRVINKPISDEDFLNKVEEVFAKGWNLIKLYFMVGLPTETDEDIEAIGYLVKQAMARGRKHRKRVNINVGVSTFVPKSHTPFQWARQISIEEIEEKRALLKKYIRSRGVNLSTHDASSTFLEGAFARGDRRLGKVLLSAYRRGCRFDGWTEQLNFQAWMDAFKESLPEIDPSSYLRERALNEILPWDHISPLIEKRFLIEEWNKSLTGDITPDCRRRGCSLCGVILSDKHLCINMKKVVREGIKADDKHIAIPERKPESTPVQKIRIRLSKEGEARFISHRELNNALTRALRRAKLPVAFTQGFTPRPKISFSQPSSVGIESHADFVDIELHNKIDPHQLMERLNDTLPKTLRTLESHEIPLKTPHLANQIVQSVYRVSVPRALAGDKEECQAKIQKFMGDHEIWFERRKNDGKLQKINIRPLVEEIRIVDEAPDMIVLDMKLKDSNTSKGRPNEVLRLLFDAQEDELVELLVCKVDSF
ncbi:MAG: TIGR03960 family B12-binding radical SAM protein, partial [Candidatus Poribacteria bacterium]